MNISDLGLKLIESVEGKKSRVYLDSGGAPTIGIGHLLTKDEKSSGKINVKYANPHNNELIKYADGLTDKQIYALLRSDLISVESILTISVKVPLTQNQFDALCSFIFNIGVNAFNNSTLLKKLNKAEYNSVPTQMMKWVMDNGRVISGLKNRREQEILMWNGLWKNGKDTQG